VRRAGLSRLAATALAALAAPAGAAQPAQPEQPAPSALPPIPAEVLAPDEEAAAILQSAAERPISLEDMSGVSAEIAASLDAFTDQILARGEQVSGWQSLGVDLREAVRARDGGLTANMALGSNEFGFERTYFADEPFDTLVPREWVLIGRHGQPVHGEDVQVEISKIGPKVFLAERVAYRRQRNALCRVRSEARFYADPAVPATQADTIALLFGLRTLPALDRRGYCQVYEEREPGVYVTRSFDSEGYRLPALELILTPIRIVARSPIPTRAAAR